MSITKTARKKIASGVTIACIEQPALGAVAIVAVQTAIHVSIGYYDRSRMILWICDFLAEAKRLQVELNLTMMNLAEKVMLKLLQHCQVETARL